MGGEHSVRLSRFRNCWTGYEQLAGSWYGAKIEVLGCWRALTCSKEPTIYSDNTSVRYTATVINRRNNHEPPTEL